MLARLARPRVVWALTALAALLTALFAWLVARHLTLDARRASQTYVRIVAGLASGREDATTDALLQLAAEIRREGIPIVITDARGVATDTMNLPRPMELDSREMRQFVAGLDRANPPQDAPAVGTIHYGSPPVRRQLRVAFGLEIAALLALVLAVYLAWRSAVRASSDRVWVAMARESAHQLGTPLTSLAGWIEQLRGGAGAAEVADHLEDDYRRLDRVARRFERIGQPPRREPIDLGALSESMAAYFRPRLPRLKNVVKLEVKVESSAPVVEGDPLLIEWALEALIKNAIDAMKGREGCVTIAVSDAPDEVLVSVEDDGPGVPASMLGDLFNPGSTTKTAGWGLGLALTRRIVEEGHGGRIELAPSQRGAKFVMGLPRGQA
ncbi:MAG TPA: HAMP domain-containing sensor histidine kinase [Gemmatimonadales bacterium]|nr:HAMP domain-containing sensor histidine kinase [Gemmatimonadales bacterium]